MLKEFLIGELPAHEKLDASDDDADDGANVAGQEADATKATPPQLLQNSTDAGNAGSQADGTDGTAADEGRRGVKGAEGEGGGAAAHVVDFGAGSGHLGIMVAWLGRAGTIWCTLVLQSSHTPFPFVFLLLSLALSRDLSLAHTLSLMYTDECALKQSCVGNLTTLRGGSMTLTNPKPIPKPASSAKQTKPNQIKIL